MNNDKNPNAFAAATQVKDGYTFQEGMTLRDYFAGQALIVVFQDQTKTPDEMAILAYMMADAMLDARN